MKQPAFIASLNSLLDGAEIISYSACVQANLYHSNVVFDRNSAMQDNPSLFLREFGCEL